MRADISPILAVIRRGRRRLRIQRIIAYAAAAAIPAAAIVAIAGILQRAQVVTTEVWIASIAATLGGVVVAAITGALRGVPDENIAARIDRASRLHGRLTNALVFARELPTAPPTVAGFMAAAIDDALGAVRRAKVAAAIPFREPRHATLAFYAIVGAVALSLVVPEPRGEPDAAPIEYSDRGERGASFAGVELGRAPEAVANPWVWTPPALEDYADTVAVLLRERAARRLTSPELVSGLATAVRILGRSLHDAPVETGPGSPAMRELPSFGDRLAEAHRDAIAIPVDDPAPYTRVYAKYERTLEEVMRAEKIPASYRYVIKRYFRKIRTDREHP